VIVSVDLDAARVSLEEPADCKKFHVAATGEGDITRLGEVLGASAVGRTEGDVAFIDIDAVRRLAATQVDDTWEADFSAMLEYARTKGWLNATGAAIQAHVEWA
jgi:hypothetical protein